MAMMKHNNESRKRYVHSPTSTEIEGNKVTLSADGKFIISKGTDEIEVRVSLISTLAKLFDLLKLSNMHVEMDEQRDIDIVHDSQVITLSKDAIGRLFSLAMTTRRIEHVSE